MPDLDTVCAGVHQRGTVNSHELVQKSPGAGAGASGAVCQGKDGSAEFCSLDREKRRVSRGWNRRPSEIRTWFWMIITRSRSQDTPQLLFNYRWLSCSRSPQLESGIVPELSFFFRLGGVGVI